MRYAIFFWAFLGQLVVANAQAPTAPTSDIRAGYSFGLSYNLYSWHRAPNPTASDNSYYSTGQVLNILPGVHAGFWVGDLKKWLLSIEGEITFLPFALSLQQYQGLGVVQIPTLIKYQFPLSRQQSLWTFLHVGAGVQWQSLDVYDRAPLPPYQRQYWTYIAEVGWHLSAVAHQRHRVRSLEYFIQFGMNPSAAISVQTGLRMRFRNGTK